MWEGILLPKTDEAHACVVCGKKAAKTHIFPRALMHDLRLEAKHLVVGSAHEDGTRFSQSGDWAYLLCDEHERDLHEPDTYGVEFCRQSRQRATSVSRDEYYEVPNPRPDLLTKFAVSVVWRHVQGPMGRKLSFTLGPHEAPIRSALFCGGALQYQLGLNTTTLGLRGEPADIVSFPFRAKLAGINCWRFTVSRIEFTVLISNQKLAKMFDTTLGSSADPAVVLRMPLREVTDSPHGAIFDRMRRRRDQREFLRAKRT